MLSRVHGERAGRRGGKGNAKQRDFWSLRSGPLSIFCPVLTLSRPGVGGGGGVVDSAPGDFEPEKRF